MQLTGTRPEDWIMRTMDGVNGPDAEYVGPPSTDPGFKYAELKPNPPYSTGTLGGQLETWSLPPWNILPGEVQLFTITSKE